MSELHCGLLNRKQVEALLALHAFLLPRIIWRESCGVCAHGGVLILIMELIKQDKKVYKLLSLKFSAYLEGVDALALLVEAISEIHFDYFIYKYKQ